MEAARKSLELQAQVRQNSEVVKNTLNDLYNWEKEIKDKEKIMQSQSEDNKERENLNLPIRSQIKEAFVQENSVATVPSGPNTGMNESSNSLLSLSPEKQDSPKDSTELLHKEANEMKDRGNKLVKMLDYNRAIEAYTQAIELYDNDAAYYSNRALCYLKLERYDECIEDCEKAIDIDRLAVKAYYRRMISNESLGNNMDALKDCTTVLMIDPKNIEAKRSLDRINERLRKNAHNSQGPNFTPLRSNLVDILPIDKPAYKRSTKPLCRIAIADVVGPKEGKNYENLTISDEDIDKIFNSNCGQFEEIKEPVNKENQKEKKPAFEQHEKPSKIQENQRQNFASTSTKSESNKVEIVSYNQEERPLPPTPTSTAQFYSNWKELTPKQKYQYLRSIPLKHVCKILGGGFDSDTLSDIINTLHDFYLLEEDPNTANTLLEVSKNKQVSILSLLMSTEERTTLSDIIKSLENTGSIDVPSVKQIVHNFNLN